MPITSLVSIGPGIGNKIPALGFERGRPQATRRNLAKFAAMIPVIGAIIGLVRIIAAHKCADLDAHEKRPHYARGVVEILGLGSLLFIPDLIATIAKTGRSRAYVPIV